MSDLNLPLSPSACFLLANPAGSFCASGDGLDELLGAGRWGIRTWPVRSLLRAEDGPSRGRRGGSDSSLSSQRIEIARPGITSSLIIGSGVAESLALLQFVGAVIAAWMIVYGTVRRQSTPAANGPLQLTW
ncbi:hypothetical protein BV20DRAFT_86306 [Pilatotrama ljubarskyi]|nr:hypothetical protein BV20DRAFT_86306 [Pilatotrama ljubarskyi]